MEDKDRPTQLSDKKRSELGSTVGIMLKICEQMFGTGKAVVIDSGFCVVKGITAWNKGVSMLVRSSKSTNTGPVLSLVTRFTGISITEMLVMLIY